MHTAGTDAQDVDRYAATALFLMTEYFERANPVLASLIVSELLALERRAGQGSPLADVVSRLRRRWRDRAQQGASAGGDHE